MESLLRVRLQRHPSKVHDGLLILGAGGQARVLAETAIAQGKFSHIAFWMTTHT